MIALFAILASVIWSCDSFPFPTVIGGFSDTTFLYGVEYVESKEQIVLVGLSNQADLFGIYTVPNGVGVAFVAMYEASAMKLKYAKAIDKSASACRDLAVTPD